MTQGNVVVPDGSRVSNDAVNLRRPALPGKPWRYRDHPGLRRRGRPRRADLRSEPSQDGAPSVREDPGAGRGRRGVMRWATLASQIPACLTRCA